VSNLVAEILLRLIKPILAVVLGVIVFTVATLFGEPATFALALLSFLCGTALILLVQEGPI
jgi:hypothetical protein